MKGLTVTEKQPGLDSWVLSHHANVRMQQRGLSRTDIGMVIALGESLSAGLTTYHFHRTHENPHFK